MSEQDLNKNNEKAEAEKETTVNETAEVAKAKEAEKAAENKTEMKVEKKEEAKAETGKEPFKKIKVIVVTSGKGGVGKTTSSAAIATGLAQKGHKTAVLDFDVGRVILILSWAAKDELFMISSM